MHDLGDDVWITVGEDNPRPVKNYLHCWRKIDPFM